MRDVAGMGMALDFKSGLIGVEGFNPECPALWKEGDHA